MPASAPAYRGKLADPEWRRHRAATASAAAHTPAVYIKRIAARAAELTAADREQLALLLASGNGGGDATA